jgi:hypothetical protein
MIFKKKNYKLQEKKLGAIWPFFYNAIGVEDRPKSF